MIRYENNAEVNNESLCALYADAWPNHDESYDFTPNLKHALGHVCASKNERLVGFVYIAWDGCQHGFLLEPTVLSKYRRQGIGTELVRRAADLARSHGVEWLHIDFDPRLFEFYSKCGFRTTEAGLMNLKEQEDAEPGNVRAKVNPKPWD